MSLIILGWDHEKKRKYPSGQLRRCPRCGNERLWELVDVSTWLTVFFVPLAAHDHEYMLSCPVCGEHEKLTEKEYQELKPAGPE